MQRRAGARLPVHPRQLYLKPEHINESVINSLEGLELDKELNERELLVKYLLGELSEAERSGIAERYFEDDDCFNELLDVENELLDRYVCESLTRKERDAFRRYLERLPDGREKEAVARSLIRLADGDNESARKILNEHAPVAGSWPQSPRNSTSKPRAMLQYTVAASLVLMVLGLTFLFFQIRRLSNANDQLRVRISGLESEKDLLEQRAHGSHPDAGSEHVRELEEQLRLEQQANEAHAQRLASLQPGKPVVASWMLTSAFRSASTPDSVTLPKSAKIVSINIPIESNEQVSTYRAIIQTTTGGQRLELAGLRADKPRRSVSLKLPADYFAETAYKLTLVGTDKDAPEPARDYYFKVNRR